MIFPNIFGLILISNFAKNSLLRQFLMRIFVWLGNFKVAMRTFSAYSFFVGKFSIIIFLCHVLTVILMETKK